MRRALIALLALPLLVVVAPAQAADAPLAGKVIVLDPGHQLGNSNPRFREQIAQTRFNGSIVKGCNTTGTATNAGFPEATFTWKVAKRLKPLLEAQGAIVLMTRTSNTRNAYGPCVWDRAGFANANKADALISIHADGAPAGAHGFFAIAPTRIKGWTTETYKVDRRLSKAMIAGMKAAGAPPANYIANQLQIRGDQSTINFSKVPTTIIEVGNMRNAKEAARMSSASGQQQYAQWLAAGIERFFAR
ncbi:MAG: N-acetylmuramoyl-L-alanine amidase [Actinomycetes bacterium]|jgi:N-acetylmuramoyl-L-alanine amidase